MEDALAGIAKRREDLDLTATFTLPLVKKIEIGSDMTKMAEAQAALHQQAQFSIGAALVQVLIENPQSRLIPVPYTVRTVRHDLDLRVAFWELRPVDGHEIEEIEGRWALGMRYLAINQGPS